MRHTAVIALFLLVAISLAPALELYMKRVVFLEDPLPTVGELVHTAPGEEEAAVLQHRLPFAIRRPTLLPAAAVRQVISPHHEGSLIIVGGRTALLPPELSVTGQAGFYRDLLLYLDAIEEEDRSSRLEIEMLGSPEIRGYDGAATPSFLTRRVGDAVEVGYRIPGGGQGILIIRIHRYAVGAPASPTLPLHRMVSDRRFALRSGERIRIRFVKGSITVTMPGRAFRSGYEGDIVPVKPYDSQERFEGLVVGRREVLVDLR